MFDEEAATVELVPALAQRPLSGVHEPIDPRISSVERPADAELDERFIRQINQYKDKDKDKDEKRSEGTEDSVRDTTIYVSVQYFFCG